MNKIVEIIVFDDGNDEFKECENIWKITKNTKFSENDTN